MRKYIVCCLFLFSFVINAEGFISGTPVKTPTGYSEIQDIKIGDWVLSCDFKNHCVEKEVTHTFQKQAAGYLEIHIGHSVIGVDEDHQIYATQANNWVLAKELNPSSELMNAAYQTRTVKEIRYISQEVILYTLSVVENHNFYVGHEDILVHNFLVMVPVLAWGAGGLVFGPAAPLAWAIGAVATILGGIAINEAAKHSNSPHDGFDNTYMESRRHESYQRPKGETHTNEDFDKMAKDQGYPTKFSEPPFDSHGKPAYTKNQREWITPDATDHTGGVWKRFIKKGGTYVREGTYDKNLNRIGD